MMENSPLVTVLMPVYNTEESFLRSSVESILNQTYRNFEFLIINDASCNNSAEVIRSYHDPRIRLLHNECNIGLTKSLNRGLKAARGEYIARMDSDDIALPDRLEKQLAYLLRHPEAAAVGALVQTFGKRSILLGAAENDSRITRIRLLFRNASITHPTALLRKSFLDRHCIQYDETLRNAQDYQLWIDILQHGEIHCMKTVMLKYRLHPGQEGEKLHENQTATSQNYCAKKIKETQLKALGMDFSNEEFKLHLSMIETELCGSTGENVRYFKKLLAANQDAKLYDPKILEKEILSLWISKGLKRLRDFRKADVLLTAYSFRLLWPPNLFYYLRYYVFSKQFMRRLKASVKR